MRGPGLGLEVYADTDYANKANDRRLVFGIVVTFGGTVVSHARKAQHVKSLSTSEAEYIAAGDGVKEAQFVRVPFGLLLRPRRVGRALRSLRTTRGLRR